MWKTSLQTTDMLLDNFVSERLDGFAGLILCSPGVVHHMSTSRLDKECP